MIRWSRGRSGSALPTSWRSTSSCISLTVVFVLVVTTLQPFADYCGDPQSILVLVALLVCLIPTTIGALLIAIGIAGMDRLVRRNVLAMSGRAVEAAGDVDVLLLDKTGTITYGNRQATACIALSGADRAISLRRRCSRRSPTRRPRAQHRRARWEVRRRWSRPGAELIEFSAATRMSGVDCRPTGRHAAGSARARDRRFGSGCTARGRRYADDARRRSWSGSAAGGTPLVVAEQVGDGAARMLGVIHLKDIVKEGMTERFDQLRAMGIRTVMVTGDNAVTARVIAAEAGVDDVLAEATPEDKLALIRREQTGGRLVAMCGDGTNDAPALAQADVGVAMNSGTVGCEGGRQHGRPRLRPDQADRHRGDRQAAADHPRRADDVLGRQRRGEVLRHPARDVRVGLPPARRAQRDAAVQPRVRDRSPP